MTTTQHTPTPDKVAHRMLTRTACPYCNGLGYQNYAAFKHGNPTPNDFIPCWKCDATGMRAALAKVSGTAHLPACRVFETDGCTCGADPSRPPHRARA